MQRTAQAVGSRRPKIEVGLDTGSADMKRDRSRTREDAPLDGSEFFRRVEEADGVDEAEWEPDSAEAADESLLDEPEDENDWEVEDVEETYEAEQPPSSRNEGSIAVPIGWTLGGLGVALAAATAALPTALAPAAQLLAAIGLTPFGLCLAGLVVGATGVGRAQAARRNAMQERRLQGLDYTIRSIADSGMRRGGGDEEAGSRDLDRMFVALQRQDEKINNLTRATKLYGKPLIDISNQVAELQNQVQDTAPMVDGVRGAVADAMAKVEAQVTQLAEQLGRTASELRSVVEDAALETAEGHEKAQQHALQQAQRNLQEVAKLREEQTRQLTERLDRLQRTGQDERQQLVDRIVGDVVAKVTTKVGEQIGHQLGQQVGDQLIAKVAEKVRAETREDLDRAVGAIRSTVAETASASAKAAPAPAGLDDLEQSVAAIQREMQGLATVLARLEARPVATAAPAPAASAPAPARSSTAAPPKASAAPAAEEEVPNKIAGARQASGKNVLGAIAKLKSMRN